MEINLTGKKALVFGSSSGIGRGILELFYKEGAKLMACARNKEKLDDINKDKKIKVELISGDLNKADEATRVTKDAIQKLHGLDILVLNTGGPPKGKFEEISQSAWQDSIQNLWLSMIDSIHVALPSLKQSGQGRILLIASSSAKEPIDNMVISNSLRAGLLGMMKTLSNEVASSGVTVNVLLPGFIDTDRLKQLGNSKDKMIGLIPSGRLGTTLDIAHLALFLASDYSSYITGQMIAVDGGRLKSF